MEENISVIYKQFYVVLLINRAFYNTIIYRVDEIKNTTIITISEVIKNFK